MAEGDVKVVYSRTTLADKSLVASMSSQISSLIEASKQHLAEEDKKEAKRLALQALVGLADIKDFLTVRKEINKEEEQKVSTWFGDMAYIFNQVGLTRGAIKCFYTATIFDDKWDFHEHTRVAGTLWNAHVFNKSRSLEMGNYKDIFRLIDEILELSSLAPRRGRLALAKIICDELIGVHNLMVYTYGVCRYGLMEVVSKECHLDGLISIDLKKAQFSLEAGDHRNVKKICSKVLTDLSEYDNVEALELWAQSLFLQKEWELAQTKLQCALKHEKSSEGKIRLKNTLAEIEREISEMPTRNEAPDREWLTETEVPKQERIDQQKKMQDRKQRPSGEPEKRKGRTKKIAKYKEKPTPSSQSSAFSSTPTAPPSVFPETHVRTRTQYSSTCSNISEQTDISSVDTTLRFDGFYSDSSMENESDENDILQDAVDNTDDEGVIEEVTFYEQSRTGQDVNQGNILDNDVLQNGLHLSDEYLRTFKKHYRDREPFYSEPLPEITLREVLKNDTNTFKRCVIQIEGSHKALCTPLSVEDDVNCIEISGRTKAGQTFNEDDVVVELLDFEHEGQRGKRFGKVVGILNRKRYKDIQNPVFVCTLDDMESHLVRPICKTLPKIHILNGNIKKKYSKLKKYKIEVYDYDQYKGILNYNPNICDIHLSERQNYVFLVVLLHWSNQNIYPLGAVIRLFQSGNSLSKALELLNLQYKVPSLYSESTTTAVENITYRLKQDESYFHPSDRDDLTHLRIFTIDPPGSKDLDDALSIEKYHGGFKVGVHIADVSSLVQKDDPIDLEARERATTFYPSIPGRLPRHMLPEPLSSNHCSLLPNQKRPALSFFFFLDSSGKPLRVAGNNFQKSLVMSKRQFTYDEVQNIINDNNTDDVFGQDIKNLFCLAKENRHRRLGNAIMAFDFDTIDSAEERVSETFEAHYLVEEFMILVNQKAAHILHKSDVFKSCLPLRCQPPPSKSNLEEFMKKNDRLISVIVRFQERQMGDITPDIETILKNGRQCEKVMLRKSTWDQMVNDPVLARKSILTDDLHPLQHLACQQWISVQECALYRSSGSLSGGEAEGHHFSLNMFPYTHCTSPIRRYIDVVVHRLLHALLSKQRSPYNKEEVEEICRHVTTVNKRARAYQRECKSLRQARELKENPMLMTCFVDGVSDRCVTLSAPEMGNMTKNNKCLEFNLLDMGFKPEIFPATESNREYVKATWKKRLYDVGKNIVARHDSRGTHELNPYKGIIFIPLFEWAKIVKCAIDGRNNDLRRMIRTASITHGCGLVDISTECEDPLLIKPNTIFSLSFSRGQCIKVQVTAEPQRGILTPTLMLYSMTDNVKCCLQHTKDPVLYLASYSQHPTSEQYKTANEYIQRWLPIMHMEAATEAVNNEESCSIRNVNVKFMNEKKGKFNLPLAFCEARNIEFSGTVSEKKNEHTDAYDWLCIKFEHRSTNPIFWVGHALINSVMEKFDRKGDEIVVVSFELHDRTPAVPYEAKRQDSLFNVEVLMKSEVDRRSETYMKQLRKVADALSGTIALKKPVQPLGKQRIELSDTIERDLHISNDEGIHPLPRNNEKQQEAIDKALRSRFSLIQGPPGTGKTYTGIKLIHLFNKINTMINREGGPRQQVLFCGPSNKSVDLVAKWMNNRLPGKLKPKFVRVYGRSIEAMDFPIPGRTFLSKRSTRNLKSDPDLKSVSLHYIIREKNKPHATKINEIDKLFKDANYRLDALSKKAELANHIKEYVHLVREASIAEIRKHDVILCTTGVGSNPKVLKSTNIYQVIVDEAGMCPEPQCLVPIIATNAQQVVLIGDHKQLRPIIKCKEAAELGMQTSLFERYALSKSSRGAEFTMLDTQYRMHPELCKFPSKTFYDGKLKTKNGLWCGNPMLIWPKDHITTFPHILVDVVGEEESLTVTTEDGNERSKSNKKEIGYVVELFRFFTNEGNGGNIMVVSQYNAQCAEIKKTLEASGFVNFSVGTVVSCQGGEWDYVIFSTVRSLPAYKIEKNPTDGWCKKNLGFITDENQINVALTRARKGLVIICNKKLLACNKVWKKLIEEYEFRGCVKKAASPSELIQSFPKMTRQQRLKQALARNIQRFGRERFDRGEATSYEGPVDEGWKVVRKSRCNP